MHAGTTRHAIPRPSLDRSGSASLWLTAGGLFCVLVWIGHRLAFAQFQWYDDEGYLLITVQQFLRGSPLYDDVYTQYGPAYYLWQAVLHAVVGIPVTHDATRLITLVVWLACSALAAVPIWLLTKRALLTAIGGVIVFFHLTQLTFEPGHPQELCLLGIVGAISLATWRLVARGKLGIPAAAALGGLLAVTALTKVNVGGFLTGAMTLALVSSLRGYAWRSTLIVAVGIAAMAAVAGLMGADLRRPDIAAWLIVVWCGLLAALVAGSERREPRGVVTARELAAVFAGSVVTALAVAAAIVAAGTSIRALFEGLFVWPLRLPAVFWRPLPVPPIAAAAAVVSLLLAVGHTRQLNTVRRSIPFISLAAGLIVFWLSIVKAYSPLFALGPSLAWLALRDGSVEPDVRAARRILVFAAILLALQAYPMPEGTQIVLGTVLLVPLAFVVLADAEREIRAGRTRPATPRPRRRQAMLAALVVVVGLSIGTRVHSHYSQGVPLDLPGAEAVRVTERQKATYAWLTTNLREHCDAFLTAPGINSLHFWTGMPPVSTLNATLWPILFDRAQQQRVLDAAAPVNRLCVVSDPRLMRGLMRTTDPASAPLLAWLAREFEPRSAFGGWEFQVRRGSGAIALYEGRWLEDGGLALELRPLGRDPVTRLDVRDVDARRSLADSEGLAVIEENGANAQAGAGIDVSRRRRIVLRGSFSAPEHTSVAVRLWTRDDRLVAIVPVATDSVPLDQPSARPDR